MGRKRIYIPNAAYHITFNTRARTTYFNEDIFCYVLADVILHAQLMKRYQVIAYKINPEHVHLLLHCTDRFTISEIVHAIKRVSAVRINQLIAHGTIDERGKLSWTHDLLTYAKAFRMKYGVPSGFPYPLFKWQDGFDDVMMQSFRQLQTTKSYIIRQAAHHKLPENIHVFVSTSIPENIIYPKIEGLSGWE